MEHFAVMAILEEGGVVVVVVVVGRGGGGVLIETYRTFRVHKTAFNKNGLFLLYVMLIIAHEQ